MSGKGRCSRIDAFGITSVILLIFLMLLVVAVSADSIERTEERQRKEATERIRRGIEEYSQSIDISDLSIDPADLGRIFSDAIKDTPYLFYVSNNLGYTYRQGGCVVTVTPKYTMEKEEAKEALSESFVMPDIKEGEISISDIWFKLYTLVLKKEYPAASDDELRTLLNEKYPLPHELDFRMS